MIKIHVVDFRPNDIPKWNSTDTLVSEYVEEIAKLSQQKIKYKIVKTTVLNQFPHLDNYKQYDSELYNEVLLNNSKALLDQFECYSIINYQRVLMSLAIFDDISNHIYDEVWLFGGPYFGFYESRMIGRESYWYNSPPLYANVRNFIVMGFNYERGVREMLHSFGHGVESILNHEIPDDEFSTWTNQYGTVHYVLGGEEYSQNERDWLLALKPEWWYLIANFTNKTSCINKIIAWIRNFL